MDVDEKFLTKINNLYPEDASKRILKALSFASEKHAGQKRESGEDYISHPYAVANILIDLSADEDTVIAGLLHDCLEDTDTTEKEIKDNFGDDVLSLLLGLKSLETIKRAYQRSNADLESLRKMFLAMGSDARIVFVKLADRLHNMQTLNFKPREKQVRIAKETMDLYVPLAERLGMGIFKRQMEDLCFYYLYPDDYKEVNDYINEYYKKSEKIIEDIAATIRSLADKNGIEARIQSRRKSNYSVFLKWKSKGKDIYDIVAHRIIVKSVQDCYTMLGEVNNKWKIVDGRIKDYIAHPKPNLYMSLHTTLLYPLEDGKDIPFEIQIRTELMHSYCEYGVAAHWIYKEKGVKNFTSGDKNAIRKELVKTGELNSEPENAEQYKDNIKQGFYLDKIFVFTPNLKVVELPKGSIPIDFAYSIHTRIGDKCIGAKINGKMVQLTTPLCTGDVVEIITSPSSKGPSRDWLKKVKSGHALSCIRAFFKRERMEENIRLGKDMLEDFAKRSGFTLGKLFEDKENLQLLQQKFKLDTLDDIYAAVGYGRLNSSAVLNKFIVALKQEEKKKKVLQAKKTARSGDSVNIGGHVDLLKKFAKCCNPIPGDEIVGFVSRGKGVTIHRKDCKCLDYVEDERKIVASWSNEDEKEFYNATIHIVANGSVNIITSITSKLADQKLEITSISLDRTKSEDAHYVVTLRVSSKRQLVEAMNKLRGLPEIYDIYRF